MLNLISPAGPDGYDAQQPVPDHARGSYEVFLCGARFRGAVGIWLRGSPTTSPTKARGDGGDNAGDNASVTETHCDTPYSGNRRLLDSGQPRKHCHMAGAGLAHPGSHLSVPFRLGLKH